MTTLPLGSLFSRTAAALLGAVTLLSAVPADARGRHGDDDRDDGRWERNERNSRHGHHDRHAGYHPHAPGYGYRYGDGYAPPVHGHGYWCERCNHGWDDRDDFYAHVHQQHLIAYPLIPGVVVSVGATWVFGY